MKDNLTHAILSYALSQPSFFQRQWYLLKGLIFYPFLRLRLRSGGKAAIQAGAQSGDDIYPLF